MFDDEELTQEKSFKEPDEDSYDNLDESENSLGLGEEDLENY